MASKTATTRFTKSGKSGTATEGLPVPQLTTVVSEDGQIPETVPGLTMTTSTDAQEIRDAVQQHREEEDDVGSQSSRSSIPSMVAANTDSGVEPQAEVLARAFMESQGQLARKCRRRGELSHLYISTQGAWMSQEVQDDVSLQRPFKQILFALAHGVHVVRVVDQGRSLKWNRYRDNKGEKVEDTRGPRREHRDDRDRRGGRYERRDDRDRRGDRYERRDDRDRRGDRYERRDDRDRRGGRYDRRDDRDRYEHRDDRQSPSPYRRGGRDEPQYDRNGRPMRNMYKRRDSRYNRGGNNTRDD